MNGIIFIVFQMEREGKIMKVCRNLMSYKREKDFIILQTNCVDIRVWFLTDEIIRIRAGFDGDFQEASYSLVMTGWDDLMDEFLKAERRRVTPADFNLEETEDSLILQGKKLKVLIQKSPFSIEVYDKEGTRLHKDVVDLAYRQDSNNRRIHTSEIEPEDYFFGFGEKSGEINKAGKFMKMAPRDAMGYNPKETDSLYKHIPFYIKLNKNTKKAVGYFYHNTAECDFDMGREKSNYWHRHSTYRTDGGDVDLFLIAGPSIRDVVGRYTDLTGKSAMLPRQALGYLGSSMYYAELEKDCDASILKFMDTAQKEKIPMDGFMLSSGYTAQETGEGLKRCVFCWNEQRFPDPKKFFRETDKRGMTISANVKPGILTCHPKFKEMEQKGFFVRDSESETPGIGTWWGGQGAFVDFTSESVRNQWKEMLKDALLVQGCDSVWNDNCEYDSMVDKDCRCYFEGKGETIGTAKAVMSNLMCRITRDVMEECNAKKRPYVVCRSGHAGIQRYAQTWAGDNLTCWDSLKYNIATILGMGLSGVANQGCDIGGFFGEAPEEELFVRWVQNGIFQPRFSIHSVNVDNTVTEPWMYEKVTPIIREAIWLRYHLMPYFYSLMYRAHETGLPIMEPMCSAFQWDERCYEEGIDFMLGASLLVANVVEKGAQSRKIYLPEEEDFYDFWTGEFYPGGQTIEIPVTLTSIPLFVRAGGIIPMTTDELHPLRDARMKQLTLRLAPGKKQTFTLYEDDGVSNAYETGDYLKTEISMEGSSVITLDFKSQGEYRTSVEDILLELHSPKKAPLFVSVCGGEIEHFLYKKDFEKASEGWFYDMDNRLVEIKYNKPEEKDYQVVISFEPFDMIGM